MPLITPSKAPNLVQAPLQYSQLSQEQLTNQLRLYFNTLDKDNAQLIAAVNSLTVMAWLGGGGGGGCC